MSVEPVVDWDALFKKGVRSKDGKDVGIVVGVSEGNLFVQKGVRREYVIPKNYVDGFDGAHVYLKVPEAELIQYEIKI